MKININFLNCIAGIWLEIPTVFVMLGIRLNQRNQKILYLRLPEIYLQGLRNNSETAKTISQLFHFFKKCENSSRAYK